MICIRMTSIFPRLQFWHDFPAKIRSKALHSEQWLQAKTTVYWSADRIDGVEPIYV